MCDLRVRSQGYKQVSIYLDGRRLKTWRPAAAQPAKLAIRINPRGLPYGSHRVLAKPVARDRACGVKPVSQVFAYEHARRPRPAG